MEPVRRAKGFLFDLDGVFYQSGKPLPGAIETLIYLRKNKIPFRFLTNTTIKNRSSLQEKLNEAFQHVMNGAEIIALHKGKYYKVDSGLRLDAGGFVAALGFATGQKAHVVGKPNKAFFQCALDDLSLTPEDVVMFGDDLINDVQGAQNHRIPGILVKSGKYHEGMVESSGINPDGLIDSIADLPTILNS